MWYTHRMTSIPATTDRHAALDALDDALVELRQVQLRPGYRRRLLDGLATDVPLAVLRLLRVVQRADEPPTIGAVADVLVVDPSTASRVVDRAVDGGYLERRACDDDRRRARLQLSSRGEELLEAVTQRRRDLLAEVASDWTADELAAMVARIERLQAGFDALEGSA